MDKGGAQGILEFRGTHPYKSSKGDESQYIRESTGTCHPLSPQMDKDGDTASQNLGVHVLKYKGGTNPLRILVHTPQMSPLMGMVEVRGGTRSFRI